jgi:hypothetical protein
MMPRPWTIVVLASLVAHTGARDAGACSCISSGPPCQAAWNADAVFAGSVRSIEVTTEEIPGSTRILETVVHFEVDQPLLNAVEGRIDIVSTGLSTCDYRFTNGQKYLVYAWKREDGRWTTSICSRTRRLAEAAEDLHFLTTMPRSGTGARVYGRVNEWAQHPADEHGVDFGPLEHVTVNVRGATFSADRVTDKDGRYELTGIPLGTVSISVVTPFGFHGGDERKMDVKDLRGCVAADFTLRAESTAHGIVVDQSGQPVGGVSVEAVAEELAGYQPKAIHPPATTDNKGRFSFDRLPPGAYVFGINITKGLYKPPSGRPTFLPGTAVATQATVFNLKPGDQTDVGTIRLASW